MIQNMDKAITFFKINSLRIEIMVAFVVSSIFTIAQVYSAMGQECSKDDGHFAISNCDGIFGPCPQGETRGESGFCAPMPELCPQGTKIDEDPICEPISEQPAEVRNVQWAQ